MKEARNSVASMLRDRSIDVATSETGDLRFEYRSVPMRISFDETKHREPDMTIELDESPTPDRMACWAYRIITPWWQDSLPDRDDAEFQEMIDSTLNALAADADELQRLTSEAHEDVAAFLDSRRIPYAIGAHGKYRIEWNSATLELELERNPGRTDLAVSTRWGRKGFIVGRTVQHLPVPIDGEQLLRLLDSVALTGGAEGKKVRGWLE